MILLCKVGMQKRSKHLTELLINRKLLAKTIKPPGLRAKTSRNTHSLKNNLTLRYKILATLISKVRKHFRYKRTNNKTHYTNSQGWNLFESYVNPYK